MALLFWPSFARNQAIHHFNLEEKHFFLFFLQRKLAKIDGLTRRKLATF